MTTLARAVISRGEGPRVTVEEISVPSPQPGEVVVRVLACGVCHSDLTAASRPSPDRPIVLGHEVAGVVEEVGEQVRNVTAGDFVVVAWRAPCGACRPCRRGEPWQCSATLTASQPVTLADGTPLSAMLGIGGFADRTLVSAAQAIKLDRVGRPEALALIGCGVMTGFGAATITGGVRQGDVVAVFGCGGVGDSAIAGARLAGAGRVIAVDTNARKLEWARQFGATDVVNGSERAAAQAVRDLTGGAGADVVIEAVGTPEAYLEAFRSCSSAGTFVQVGVPRPQTSVELSMTELFRGPITKPSHYGGCLPTRDFPLLVDLYAREKLDLDALVSQTITLDQVGKAFAQLEGGEVLRSVVVF
jgi:S-(hydroxymethyl)mycothiol dehydrogenase